MRNLLFSKGGTGANINLSFQFKTTKKSGQSHAPSRSPSRYASPVKLRPVGKWSNKPERGDKWIESADDSNARYVWEKTKNYFGCVGIKLRPTQLFNFYLNLGYLKY